MKLQARKSVVRKPKTVEITGFFKKFCIATRTTKTIVSDFETVVFCTFLMDFKK